MPYLGVLEAVRARLEGNSPNFVPPIPDIASNWDHEQPDRIEGVNQQAIVDAYLRQDRFAYVGRLKVPIYLFDIEGQQFDTIYPSLTYEILDVVPRYRNFIFQSSTTQEDVYEIPVETTTQPVIDQDGNFLGNYPRAIRTRLVEHPLDILFEVRAYANDPIISALLVEYVYTIFPPRYYIKVPMKDGSNRSWDVLFENYRDLDKREAVRAGTPGVQREYAKVWTYRVEGYFDNTDTTDIVNVVRKQKLSVHKGVQASTVSQISHPVVWMPSSSYATKGIVIPFSSSTSLQFVCVVAGVSSETEPTWPTIVGTQIVDGTVTWQAVG